ncbi:P-loop NTPase [Chloroflexota bacterium]
MVSEKEVENVLNEVLVPGVKRSITDLNMLRNIEITDELIKVTLASAGLQPDNQDWLSTNIKEVLEKLPGVGSAKVEMQKVEPQELNQITHVIATMSGKGGVGKSMVAGLTAVALNRQGYKVGILDADLTGPSIPRMFGVNDRPGGNETAILPVLSRSGIEVMSINLLLPEEESALIWRGPLISKTIQQFWGQVVWGKLDYLVVDLPPGTADAPLTVMQSLPLSGVIIVFTSQSLTTMIVKKAIDMARKLEKPILGVVENMSYLYVPEIDKRIEVFGKSSGEEMSQAANAPLLGRLPIEPGLGKLCDDGDIERYSSEAFAEFSQALIKALPQGE